MWESFKKMYLFLFIYEYVYVWVGTEVQVPLKARRGCAHECGYVCGGQRTNILLETRAGLSLLNTSPRSIPWVPGVELRLSG